MGKKFIVKVRGEAYEVEVEEMIEEGCAVATAVAPASQASATPAPKPQAPVATPALAPKVEPVAGGEKVTAPLPGTVLQVKVKVGDKVKSGDVVVMLEAMKLENEISTYTAGEVKQVLVTPGTAVNEGDVLVVVG